MTLRVARLGAAIAIAGGLSAGVIAMSPGYGTARSDYIEHCAGCHGMTGSSAPARVPLLKGRVGYFLCTQRGRDYLVRLPNVARAPVSDDAALADLMNFVVFEIGRGSAPAGAKPFDVEEVAALRKAPLIGGSPIGERRKIVEYTLRHCPQTPVALRSAT